MSRRFLMGAGTLVQKERARTAERQLGDLISIGPAMLRDFELLGIRSVAQLARQNPQQLYAKLGRVARQHQDICVLDTFCAAVAQAKNPRLPPRNVSGGIGAGSARRERNEENGHCRGTRTASGQRPGTGIPEKIEESCETGRKSGADDTGPGAAEFAGGASDARVSSKCGTGAA